MTSDLCTDDVVVCMTSPQMITSEGSPRGGRVAASSAAVELGRRLLLAARAGNTPLVLDLMAQGAPFTTDWLGTSPLHLAASNNHVETCAVLLRAGVSRDARTKVERTPLHMAAYAGHHDVVALLLQHHAAPDCRDMLRMSPLHWAASRGHARVVRALLAAGARPRLRDKFRRTPADHARRHSHHHVLAMLRDAPDTGSAASPPPESAESPPGAASVRRVAGARDAEPDATPGFQPLHRLQEIKTNIKTKVQQDKPSNTNTKTEVGSNTSKPSPAGAALLRRHGITLLPADDGSTVLSALQSGRTVVLSDAGKLMLKESSPPAAEPTALLSPISTASAAATSVASAVSVASMPSVASVADSPAGKGLKLITLNNKLLLPHKNSNITNLSNVQLSQVKFVQLKQPPSPRPRAKRARHATPVKIIVNKNNYKLLGDAAPAADQPGPASPSESASLRAQLAAARKAIAALTAELAAAKARLRALGANAS